MTNALDAGWPTELRDPGTGVWYTTRCAGTWPDAFFLIWTKMAMRKRVRIAQWKGHAWSKPLADRLVPVTMLVEPHERADGTFTIYLGGQELAFRAEGLVPTSAKKGGKATTPAMPKRTRATVRPKPKCVVLPTLVPKAGRKDEYRVSARGFTLTPTSFDGEWIVSERKGRGDPLHHRRTFFLFRLDP